jgi:hypothetical protein
MSRYVIITSFLMLALAAACAFAADNSAGKDEAVGSGGLSCFSIQPPDAPTQRAAAHVPARYRSCDELCAAKRAACTAATGMHNPPYSCASTDYDPSSTLCRCCGETR